MFPIHLRLPNSIASNKVSFFALTRCNTVVAEEIQLVSIGGIKGIVSQYMDCTLYTHTHYIHIPYTHIQLVAIRTTNWRL